MNNKETIGKIRSLMERVEGDMSPFEASVNEQMHIDEALNEAEKRTFVGPNELFDTISELKSNARVCVGYITGAKLNYPTVKRKNPETNRMKTYDDFETFGKNLGVEEEIVGVVKISRYHGFNFRSHDDVNSNYSKFAEFEDDLRTRYDMPPINRGSGRGQYTSKQEYGKNGITTYSGNDEVKMGRTYNRQNIHGATVDSIYCLIGTDGNCIKELTRNELLDYITPREVNGVSILRKLGREEEEIQRYIEEYKSLKMNFISFINDKVLYVAGSTENKERFTYFNNDFPTEVDGVKINPQEFKEKALKLFKIDKSKL